MTLAQLPLQKAWKPSSALTLKEGLFSVWKGQRPTQRCPWRFSAACSPISATMSAHQNQEFRLLACEVVRLTPLGSLKTVAQ